MKIALILLALIPIFSQAAELVDMQAVRLERRIQNFSGNLIPAENWSLDGHMALFRFFVDRAHGVLVLDRWQNGHAARIFEAPLSELPPFAVPKTYGSGEHGLIVDDGVLPLERYSRITDPDPLLEVGTLAGNLIRLQMSTAGVTNFYMLMKHMDLAHDESLRARFLREDTHFRQHSEEGVSPAAFLAGDYMPVREKSCQASLLQGMRSAY